VAELDLIRYIREHTPGAPGVLVGPGDDAAVLAWAGADAVVLATDAVVEGTHFASGAAPEVVGWKALCENLSDLAAMGAEPVACTATLALRPELPESFARGFHAGLVRAAERFACPLVGGDVVTTAGPIVATVTVLGRAPGSAVWTRGGARAGDTLFVTGELGGSLASGKHFSFVPRLEEMRALRERGCVTACIDISDGLARDLGHLCRESSTGAEIEQASIPLSAAARAAADPLASALGDGEDFELLFAVQPGSADALAREWSLATPLARIGRLTPPEEGLRLAGPGGTRPLPDLGYEHPVG